MALVPAYFLLLLSAVSLSSLEVILRIAQNKGRNVMVIIIVNYCAAASVSCAALFTFGVERLSSYTIYLGIITGIAYTTAMVLMMTSFPQRGVVLTGTIVQLSVLIPTIISVLIWAEKISSIQGYGIIIAILSLPLLSVKSDEGGANRKSLLTALALFLVNGFGLAAGKILLEAGYVGEQLVFYSILFASASISSMPLIALNKKSPSRLDFAVGLGVGTLNAIVSLTLVTALITIPGSISFPFLSIVSSLLLIGMSFVILHEGINKTNALGIIIAITAVVLLST